ncbi:MAG TPA: GH92 family glycosyl hydrolase [Nannocystaceae bacterium]|nr:GH92 family glycosyl hydrolase [Nannocystaceae bacterium]
MQRRVLVVLALALACSGDGGGSGGESASSGSGDAASTDATADDGTSTGADEPYEWPQELLVEYVDPFIGTGGLGYRVGTINPGASLPFGMVKPGPDTGIGGLQLSYLNCTGYHYDQTHVWGFSHSRINGMGVPDYGALLIAPTVGIDAAKIEIGGARSLFDHAREEASPGYYAVDLLDVGVHAELTATTAVALHRYTWDDPGAAAAVILDLGYNPAGGRSPASSLVISGEAQTISGMTTVLGGYSARFGGVPTYFVARFSRPFASAGAWDDAKTMMPGATAMDGAEIGAWAEFALAEGETSVEVAVAISYVSLAQAEANLAAEAPDFAFDATRAAAAAAWDDELHRVRVQGGSADDRETLYTALYHAFLAPTTFSEVGGMYRGFDGEVHEAGDSTYYSDFSLWDTYRTLHPLLNLVQRDRSGDMMQSLVRMYQQGGDLPMWPLAFGYTSGMVGTSADIVLADAALLEIAGFDGDIAYMGARLHATEERPNDGRPDIAGWIERGWIASDGGLASVSESLEFAVADHALGEWAALLGQDDDAAMFAERGRNYRNLWSEQLGFFVGRRADGTFDTTGFDPEIWLDAYAEGTAWHYVWMVPHDAAGLAELMGGEGAARERLAAYMQMSADYLASPDANANVQVPFYWQSNEPSLHDVYLFTEFGDPASTQRWVDWARREHYGVEADGLPGNDDAGTMSAWYVWSAIGLYPLPASRRWWITAPIFARVELDLGDAELPSRRLVIVADGAGPGMIYVAAAAWNGEPLAGPTIDWDRLREGGTLRLVLADAPTDFGAR